MNNKLIVSPSPHMLSNNSTSNIMFDVIVALFPALIASIFMFGPRALVVTLVCIASSVLFEYLSRKMMKRTNTIKDLSAVVTGMLLAFNLPPSIPLWMAVLGSFFAIVVAKQLFGGIGQNFANPALVGRIILFVSFSTAMTTWSLPVGKVDAIAEATVLSSLNAEHGFFKFLMANELVNADTFNMFIGRMAGCLGEVSALALIIGGIYLVARKVISPLIPCIYIGTVFLMTWSMGVNPLSNILSGGLMLGAIFMATDYSTTPATTKGKIIFALGCGVITTLIRVFGSYPEGVSFAILIMNLFTPLIDRCTKTKPFGVVGGAKNV